MTLPPKAGKTILVCGELPQEQDTWQTEEEEEAVEEAAEKWKKWRKWKNVYIVQRNKYRLIM